MQAALRPYATAGVALVGASVIAVSPVTVTPTAVQEVRASAVRLSSLVNPIDVFAPIVESAIANIQAAGQTVVDNPAPILTQLIRNQIANIAGLPEAIGNQLEITPELPGLLGEALTSELNNLGTLTGLGSSFIQNVIGAITATGENTAQASLQTAIDDILNNDLGGAFTSLAQVPLQLLIGKDFGNLAVIFALIPALQQPLVDAQKLLPIAAGPLGNAEAALGVLATVPLALGLGVLTPVINGGAALGKSVSELIDAVQTADPEKAFNSIVEGSGDVTKALLDSIADDFGGGLLPQIQSLREQIAEAIGKTPPSMFLASPNALPSATVKSVTLTAPLEKAPASTAGTPSGDNASGSGAVSTANPSTGTTDPSGVGIQPNKGDLKGGNLFTPGTTATKGGRHRADTGSFAQGLRDAAEKTIKGLTDLGHSNKSETSASASTGSESGSSSSGSGGSSSAGDTGSK